MTYENTPTMDMMIVILRRLFGTAVAFFTLASSKKSLETLVLLESSQRNS